MATAYARGILIGASESLVNMQRFGSAIDLDLRFCIFAIFVLALYYFLGGSWGTLGPSTASEGRVTIHCKYAAMRFGDRPRFAILYFCDFCVGPLLLFGRLLGDSWAFDGFRGTCHDPL